MHDLEVLIARTRGIQSSPGASTLQVSADLDRLVRRLENECRQLHGHYMASRGALLSLCDRLIADARAARARANVRRLGRMEPCELYLVRHAIAAERGEEWPDDTKRPLTETRHQPVQGSRRRAGVAGRRRSTRSSPARWSAPGRPRRCSPQGLANKAAVKTLEALAPGHSPRAVMNELQ